MGNKVGYDRIDGGMLMSGVLRRRRFLFTVLVGAFVFLVLPLGVIRRRNLAHPRPPVSPTDLLRPPSRNGYDRVMPDLHLLIPANVPHAELCMTLTSAVILGYPTPALINWGKTFTDFELRANGSHIGKITGVNKWMENQQLVYGDHLVMVIDGYDTLFQLRPEVLFKRYVSINKALMARTTAEMGQEAVDAEDIEQNIVFTAEKTCGPLKTLWDSPGCYAQPASPLRADLYGEGTDQLHPTKHLALKMRPQWLNSGLMLGTLRDVKAAFADAEKKIPEGGHHGSDQYIFHRIFGEQQYQREVIRQRYRGMATKVFDVLKGLVGMREPSIIDPSPIHKPMEKLDGHPAEFGIGLDYALELGQAMVMSEWDGRWLTFNDTEAVLDALRPSDYTPSPPRITSLPDDLLNTTQTPFEELERHFPDDPNPPPVTDWSQVRLWTNIWTGSIPLTLHSNGRHKSLRHKLWRHMWYRKRAREMLTARAFFSDLSTYDELVIAKSEDDKTFWTWKDLCKPFEEDLFHAGQTEENATATTNAADAAAAAVAEETAVPATDGFASSIASETVVSTTEASASLTSGSTSTPSLLSTSTASNISAASVSSTSSSASTMATLLNSSASASASRSSSSSSSSTSTAVAVP